MSARWNETVRLGDVWKNEALTFEERRDEIARRIKVTRWYRHDSLGAVADVVDDIQNATTVSRFDIAWGDLYDLADEDRVWIDIYSVPAA